MKTYQLYINGNYVDPANGEWFDSVASLGGSRVGLTCLASDPKVVRLFPRAGDFRRLSCRFCALMWGMGKGR